MKLIVAPFTTESRGTIIESIKKFRETLLAYEPLDRVAYDRLLKTLDDLLTEEIAKVKAAGK